MKYLLILVVVVFMSCSGLNSPVDYQPLDPTIQKQVIFETMDGTITIYQDWTDRWWTKVPGQGFYFYQGTSFMGTPYTGNVMLLNTPQDVFTNDSLLITLDYEGILYYIPKYQSEYLVKWANGEFDSLYLKLKQ